MSEILPVGGSVPPLATRLAGVRVEPNVRLAPPPTRSDPPTRFDEELQRVLSRTSFRLARLRAVRADIEAGTFETKERIQGTVGRLIDVLQ